MSVSIVEKGTQNVYLSSDPPEWTLTKRGGGKLRRRHEVMHLALGECRTVQTAEVQLGHDRVDVRRKVTCLPNIGSRR